MYVLMLSTKEDRRLAVKRLYEDGVLVLNPVKKGYDHVLSS